MAKPYSYEIYACLNCERAECDNCFERKSYKKEQIKYEVGAIRELKSAGKSRKEICETLGMSITTYKRRRRLMEEGSKNHVNAS